MYSEGLKWCLALQLLLPHCFLETRIQGQLANPKFAISGSNVRLQIPNLPKSYLRLVWFYTADQKILEWETNQPTPDYFKTKFKDRVTLDLQNGTLYIYNVQEEDSSIYTLKVVLKSGFEEGWSIPLKVFDPVPKPDITIEKTQEMNNSCHLILSCMARSPSVNYTWYGDSGPISERLQSGVLNITVIPQNSSKFYRCEVSNPVSQNNDTVYFISPCELAQSSGVAWIPMWLMVIVPTILGLLLI
ncbi:CD48 antigen [Eptesicus fuscus]|uniref:CD48 antigen n=1 Tax=Eptesicus fuscus TaxID=29078 RepID=UPI0024042218|nr:CD48 antigen [Eptesicus fuscus]